MAAGGDVPCGACTACCWNEVVPLTAADNPRDYDTEWLNGWRVLRHRPDGACVYLGKRGCRIWTKRPKVCRAFDCRRFALQHLAGKHEGVIKDDAVMQAGLERLASLREP
jgi:Fe-S-cluster containining protein